MQKNRKEHIVLFEVIPQVQLL